MNEELIYMFEDNIIKWYEFENLNSILQVGKSTNINLYLKSIFKNVAQVDDFEELKEETKFDYILFYGITDEKKLENIDNYLSENGKVIVIGNNKFAIQNWTNYNPNELDQNIENNNFKCTTINKIIKILKNNGFEKNNIFYVFPNYTFCELIINDKYNIRTTQIEKYNPLIKNVDIKIFDEIKLLKNIIKDEPEMLKFFSNSFFIEATKNNLDNNINYVSFNNWRKEKYRLITIIKDNVVIKKSANKFADKHLENMKKIIKYIHEDQIELLDYEENKNIYSKLIKNEKTLDEILSENYNNIDILLKIFNDLKQILLTRAITYYECKEKIKIETEEKELIEEMHFMKNAFWDMIPKNCFLIQDKYVFFDQEWSREYMPVEFVIYRAVINSYDLVRKINVDDLLDKLGILKYKNFFEKIDEELREEIIDKDIFEEIYINKPKKLDEILGELKIKETNINQIQEDNNNKQIYIERLEEDNKNKQEYIHCLEEDNMKKQKYIKELEKISKNKKEKTLRGFFRKR